MGQAGAVRGAIGVARARFIIMAQSRSDDHAPGGVPERDVDPRLLQANERTMLAWTRTGIALMTFGFVIARLGAWMGALGTPDRRDPLDSVHTVWIGAAFVALGAVANAIAIRRYIAARRAIREGRGIRDDAFPTLFAVLVTALGAIIGAYLLYRLM